jgi:multiple sugar transport system ATP-binding protein
MAGVRLQGIQKSFGDTHVVRGIDLTIEDGEFMVLVGASGCGKSTLLRMVAGLENPTSGRIHIGDRDVTELRPRDRDIAMVFQSYALYPHLTVRENMGFGLMVRGTDTATIKRQVDEAAELLELGPLLDRYPKQLSGGQRQRVAMGRAIVRRPQVFLFDEPLSNLDASLRAQMRVELKKLHQRLGVTMIYVTHDQVEAMTLADRIMLLQGGRVQQVGPPRSLYDWPANRYTASFLGSPGMNFLPARLSDPAVQAIGVDLLIDPSMLLEGTEDGPVVLGVRPHDIRLKAQPGDGSFSARIEVLEPMGWETHVHLSVANVSWVARFDAEESWNLSPGQTVRCHVAPDALRLFHPDDGRALCGPPSHHNQRQAS